MKRSIFLSLIMSLGILSSASNIKTNLPEKIFYGTLTTVSATATAFSLYLAKYYKPENIVDAIFSWPAIAGGRLLVVPCGILTLLCAKKLYDASKKK